MKRKRLGLIAVLVALVCIALAGAAGLSKEGEMSEEAKRESIKEFSFVKGMIVATISGVFSAGMSYAMAAAEPLSVTSAYFGTEALWVGLPKLCVILLGGFLTNFIWCLILLLKNGTLYQYLSRFTKDEYATDAAGKATKTLKEGVKPASLLHIDGYQTSDGHYEHRHEASQLSHDDGENDESHEGESDGHSCEGQEPSAYSHKLKRSLKSLEHRTSNIIHFHN